MKMIKVERMPQTVHYSGKTYGPSEKPLNVPEELAAALGLTPANGSFSAEATAEVDHQELEASRTLATQAKDNLDKLVVQLAPLAQDGEMPDQVLARVVSELDGKVREAAHAVEQWGVTQEQVNALTAQLAEAQARPVLPADARERLIKVKGISDALADQALEALKAEPEQPQGG